MELIQPLSTTAVRLVTATQTGGSGFIPDAIRAAKERYRFWQVPQTMEEYTRKQGAEFRTGYFQGNTIGLLRMFSDGILAEGNVHSAVLDDFLDDVLDWASSAFGVTYVTRLPVSRAYTSTVEVETNASVGRYAAGLTEVASLLTSMLDQAGFEMSPYEFTALIATTDPTKTTTIQPGRFVFERRAGRSFDSNVYFSEAPVSTENHMLLLERLEAVLTSVPRRLS